MKNVLSKKQFNSKFLWGIFTADNTFLLDFIYFYKKVKSSSPDLLQRKKQNHYYDYWNTDNETRTKNFSRALHINKAYLLVLLFFFFIYKKVINKWLFLRLGMKTRLYSGVWNFSIFISQIQLYVFWSRELTCINDCCTFLLHFEYSAK